MMINKVNDSLHYWIIGNVFPEQCVLCVSHRQIKPECMHLEQMENMNCLEECYRVVSRKYMKVKSRGQDLVVQSVEDSWEDIFCLQCRDASPHISHNKSYHNKYHYTTQTLSARPPGELIYRCQVTHIHFEYYLKQLYSQLESCSALFTVTQQGKICEKNIPIYLGESHKVVELDQLKTMKHCTGTCRHSWRRSLFFLLDRTSSGSETEN